MSSVFRHGALASFSCLGERCEDTCCQSWSMLLNRTTLDLYQKEKPDLLGAVEPGGDCAGEPEWIMRKDPKTGFCVKLEAGLCGIQKAHGEKFLGDACYFYPRVTRKLGDTVVMTATLSCPEIARIALFKEPENALLAQWDAPRLPESLKNYAPSGLDGGEALAVHHMFMQAAALPDGSAEMTFLRLAGVARSLELIDKKNWRQALPLYLRLAEERLPAAQSLPADPFNLLHALAGLITASRKPPSARLRQTLAEMEQALAAKLDWQRILIVTSDKSLPAFHTVRDLWNKEGAARAGDCLRRYLAMQLSLSLFPFAGLGDTLHDRVTLLGVRLATVKLALMCAHSLYGEDFSPDIMLRVVQSLSRFLDHLGDAGLMLLACDETGWRHEARLRGLLGA